MKHYVALILIIVITAGCFAEPAIVPTASPAPTMTSSPIPPTATFTPTPMPPTETPIPSPTPLPGKLVLPLETLGNSIPWLPVDETARPVVHYVAFNSQRPPFNSPLVRQAFAYAIDREVITEMAKNYKAGNPSPATTLTHPYILGRDLYKEVGIGFDPQKAKEALTEAGYIDPTVFPPVTFIVNSYGDIAPGARFNMANTMADMWKEYLGVSVEVQAMTPPGFGDRLKKDPPEIFWLGWAADQNDPDNFLRGIFHSSSEYNFGGYQSSEFDQLVDQAALLTDPAQRQELYLQAERRLCETDAALIPLYHTR